MTKTYAILEGRRYNKLVAYDGGSASAVAFLDSVTGHWLQAGSWSAPLKSRRLADPTKIEKILTEMVAANEVVIDTADLSLTLDEVQTLVDGLQARGAETHKAFQDGTIDVCIDLELFKR